MRILALLLAAALALFIVASPPMADALRARVFDGWQRLLPLERTAQPVTIVAIDEPALQRVGQWPWPRTRLADLVEAIARAHPAAIALDLFFPEPDRFSPTEIAAQLPIVPAALEQALAALPSNDQRLAAAMRAAPVVLGIAAMVEPDARFRAAPHAAPVVVPGGAELALAEFGGHIGNVAPLDAAAQGRGLVNTGAVEQVVRTVPMVARVQGAIVPALGVEALRVASGSGLRLDAMGDGRLRLRFDGVDAPLQEDGSAWLRFGRHDPARFVSAADVLSGKANPELLRGKVVLVGIDGVGLLDFKTTPLGELVPGVEVHAQLVENLYGGVALTRPGAAAWAEALALAIGALLVVVLVPRLAALRGATLAVSLLCAIVAASLVAFARYGVLLDAAWPAAGILGVYGAVVVGSLSEADRQRRVLREQATRVAGEMDAARRIQMGLLPDPRRLLGDDRRVRLAALLEPARSVGGDFYDCFRLDARRLCIIVADVSGKGLPAALFMAATKSQIKGAALAGGTMGEVLSRVHAEIARENPEQLFVTVFAGALDLETGDFDYANAGHEPPFVRRPSGVPERFDTSGGPPLGVVDGFAYPTGHHRFAAREWLCVVSDGVTEAMNGAGEFFSAQRLQASLTWLPDAAQPQEVVQRVREDVARFRAGAEAADDLAVLALRWEGA